MVQNYQFPYFAYVHIPIHSFLCTQIFLKYNNCNKMCIIVTKIRISYYVLDYIISMTPLHIVQNNLFVFVKTLQYINIQLAIDNVTVRISAWDFHFSIFFFLSLLIAHRTVSVLSSHVLQNGVNKLLGITYAL